MLELRQGLETLQSSEMMPKSTSTQISSPGNIGKGVFQNPHFQSNCLHITALASYFSQVFISKTLQFTKLIDLKAYIHGSETTQGMKINC